MLVRSSGVSNKWVTKYWSGVNRSTSGANFTYVNFIVFLEKISFLQLSGWSRWASRNMSWGRSGISLGPWRFYSRFWSGPFLRIFSESFVEVFNFLIVQDTSVIKMRIVHGESIPKCKPYVLHWMFQQNIPLFCKTLCRVFVFKLERLLYNIKTYMVTDRHAGKRTSHVVIIYYNTISWNI